MDKPPFPYARDTAAGVKQVDFGDQDMSLYSTVRRLGECHDARRATGRFDRPCISLVDFVEPMP